MNRAPPRRHWRSYGNDPLPTGAEAMGGALRRVPVMVHARHL
jgi:hypothetical protein